MVTEPFLPIGMPRDASSDDPLDQRVGLHLLEALDSLDAVYKSAAFFADVDCQASLAEYTLTRCLDSVRASKGALFLTDGERLVLHGDRAGAAQSLAADALDRAEIALQPRLLNGADAGMLLAPGVAPENLLTCPILANDRLLGLVVLLAPPGAPFSSVDTKLVGAVASQAAIALSSAQHHREAELERQKLRLVVQNHHDGIAVLDAQGNTTLCNAIARALLGTDDVLAGLGAADASLTLAALTGGANARELAVVDGEHRRVLSVEGRALGFHDGAAGDIVVTIRDLTRQRRDERLNRNFVSLISHKLRTPLTALSCALQLLELTPVGEHPALLAEMNHRMHDLGALIDRLFDFTDLLEGASRKGGCGDLYEVRNELTAHFAGRADAQDAELVWQLQPDAREVPIPTGRLRLALLNLIENAIKFSGEDRPWVRISAARRGAGVCIEVEDQGPGIPATEQASVLHSFTQVDQDFTGNVPGAGIGVAMVREIVGRTGGSLELRSAEPHGCVFTMTLPDSPCGGAG